MPPKTNTNLKISSFLEQCRCSYLPCHTLDITAEDIFAAAEAVANFKWLVPLFDNKEVNRVAPFFQQFPNQQYDVIGLITNN